MELSAHRTAQQPVQLQISNDEGFQEILTLLTFYLNNIFRLLLIISPHKNLIFSGLKSIFKTSEIGVQLLESLAITGLELHTKICVLLSFICNMTQRGGDHAKR